jgi:hypothetical protein
LPAPDPVRAFTENTGKLEMAIRSLAAVSDLCVAVAETNPHSSLSAVNADNLASLLDFIGNSMRDAISKLEYPK